MDLAQRLKAFMETYSLASTTFADKCGIPRPSFSQLLNGRNKKVSDEVIGKIHDAYPQLNVLWLMFGEGNMENNTNIQFSEPQNNDFRFDFEAQHPENKENASYKESDSTYSSETDKKINSLRSPSHIPANPLSPSSEPLIPNNVVSTNPQPTVTVSLDSVRKVSSIMVFYTDNSFETFVPK